MEDDREFTVKRSLGEEEEEGKGEEVKKKPFVESDSSHYFPVKIITISFILIYSGNYFIPIRIVSGWNDNC